MPTIADELRAEGRTEGRLEGRTEGRLEGRTEGLCLAIQDLIELRFPGESESIITRVKSLTSLPSLTELHRKACVCQSVAELDEFLGQL